MRKLVPTAVVYIAGSQLQVEERFPKMPSFKPQEWNLLMTVGAVRVALNDLLVQVKREEFALYFDRICKDLDAWNPNASRALEDCREFTSRVINESKYPELQSRDPHGAFDALGLWVLWNLYRRAPTGSEWDPARAIGVLLSAFCDWFRAPSDATKCPTG